MGTPKDSEKTRAKLIEAAGQLFADRGYNGVTVRDIAQAAGTHLSALNYHFRSKEALHQEAILEAVKFGSITLEAQEYVQSLAPLDALHFLAREAIAHHASQKESRWRSVIIDRECWDPSPVFHQVVDEYFKPEILMFAQLIGSIADKPVDAPTVRFAAIGLIALLAIFSTYDRFVDAVAPDMRPIFRKDDWLAVHIVRMVIDAATAKDREPGT